MPSTSSAAAVQSQASKGAQSTRMRLLLASIRLSASRSLRLVPLREIYEKAGVRNGSAIRYYFGDKEGLVRAVADLLYTEVIDPIEHRLGELEKRAKTEQITVRDVVKAAFGPSLAIVLKSEYGLDAARATPRFFGEANLEIQRMFASAIDRNVKVAADLLQPLLPDKRRATIEAELRMSITMILHLTEDAFSYNKVEVEPTLAGIAESNRRVLDYLTNALGG